MEERQPSQRLRSEQFQLSDDRHQHEDSPQSVDDRWNRRQQVRQIRQRLPQEARRELGDEDGNPESDRRGQKQRQCDVEPGPGDIPVLRLMRRRQREDQ